MAKDKSSAAVEGLLLIRNQVFKNKSYSNERKILCADGIIKQVIDVLNGDMNEVYVSFR